MKLKTYTLLLTLCLTSSFLSAAELATVSHVDIERYLGVWYEIARLPHDRQKDCVESHAVYTQTKDGIEIKNVCTDDKGATRDVIGRAKIADPTTNAKLKVNFAPWLFRIFAWGNYWIIDLGKDYEYAVVSEPKKQKLWILSREKTLDKAVFDEIKRRLREKGFAVDKLIVRANATR